MDRGHLGSCQVCCLAFLLCPCCVLSRGGQSTASKYGIEERGFAACCKGFCCLLCYKGQIQHELMTKEGLHYGCMVVEKDSDAAGRIPSPESMNRA